MKDPVVYLIADNGILGWLVGSDPERAGTPKLQWANLPESWGVFVLLAIVAAIAFGVFWLYRREINTCPMPIKLLMAGLRLTVLLLLVALYLKPSVFFQQVNEIKPTIPLMRDASISIARGDRYTDSKRIEKLARATDLSAEQIAGGDISRAAIINGAFEAQGDVLTAFRDKGTIRVLDFDDGTRSIAVIPAVTKNQTSIPQNMPSIEDQQGLIQQTIPPLSAEGLGTDIWQALRTTLDEASRISSIILVSDFQHNGSENPVELAKKAATLGIPIYTVGVGDPSRPKNISVGKVYVRKQAFPNEPFEVETALQASKAGRDGLPGQVDVQLLKQVFNVQSGELEAAEVVETKSVSIPEGGGRIPLDFEQVLVTPGQYVYSVRVEPVDGESNVEDNVSRSSELKIIDDEVKVLLISGLPNWDFQQVQRLLTRDKTIRLSCWLQSMDESRPQEGDAPITQLPRTPEELGKYNVVILIDPNPQEFDRQWINLLQDFCRNKAGGVLFMAGPQFTGEFVTMNRLNPIRELLPVRFGDTDSITTTQALASVNDEQAGEMLTVNHNIDHPVMSFRSDVAETQKIWDQMPSVMWSFPTQTAKPTSRVLLERSAQSDTNKKSPLMVAGRFGSGSVLYMGFQGTWRWRRLGLQAQYFDRFWIQVVRYLVETRSLQGERRGFVDTDKKEYELGDRVTLIGRVLDSQLKPATVPTMDALVRSRDGRERKVTMKLLPQQKGSYEGTFVAQRLGAFDATLQLAEGEENKKLVEPVPFRVVTPSAESGAFWLNEPLMNEIATQSGGQAFRLDQLAELATALPTMITRAEFNSPPKPLWDINRYLRWLAFLLPVVLLSAEWALRKWYKLL